MNKIEWIPVNPCPCGAIRYPDGHKCNAEDGECSPLAYYEGAMDYQGKLLEHQLNIAVIKGNVSLKQLKEMRKQLDELMMDKSMTESDNGQLIDRGSFAKYVENKKGEK